MRKNSDSSHWSKNKNSGRYRFSARWLAIYCSHSWWSGGNFLLCWSSYLRSMGIDSFTLCRKVGSTFYSINKTVYHNIFSQSHATQHQWLDYSIGYNAEAFAFILWGKGEDFACHSSSTIQFGDYSRQWHCPVPGQWTVGVQKEKLKNH